LNHYDIEFLQFAVRVMRCVSDRKRCWC